LNTQRNKNAAAAAAAGGFGSSNSPMKENYPYSEAGYL
jgi:hypothetical protein